MFLIRRVRISRLQVSYKKSILKHLAKFTRNDTCKFIKKRFRYMCFPVNLAEFLSIIILQTPANDCFRKVRSLMESPFVKFQVFTINRTDNYFTMDKLCHIFP